MCFMANFNDYFALSDENLVSLSQNGDEYALGVLTCRFFKPESHKTGVGYLDGEDLLQEGMFGFLSAVKTFSSEKGVPFSAYARVCMNNRINTAVQKVKSDFLIVSDMQTGAEEKKDISLEDKIESTQILTEVISQCEKILTDSEKTVLFCRMSGLSYDEIAVKLGVSKKSVDNALKRARNKLKEVLSN